MREGRLAPYTYFYDHAPAGWILLAAWMALSGGPHAFGSTIDSGRVLSWYDNEWGFSNRMADTAVALGNLQ